MFFGFGIHDFDTSGIGSEDKAAKMLSVALIRRLLGTFAGGEKWKSQREHNHKNANKGEHLEKALALGSCPCVVFRVIHIFLDDNLKNQNGAN